MFANDDTMDDTMTKNAGAFNKDKEPIALVNETLDPMTVWNSTEQEDSSTNNDDAIEESSASEFIQGAMLSLSPSKEAPADAVDIASDDPDQSIEPDLIVKDSNAAALSTDTPASPNAQQAVSPRPEILVSEHSLIDDDSDDDNEGKSHEESQEKNDAPEKANVSPQGGLGAQILMNRFSSWREKANETVTRAVKTNTNRFNRKTEEHSDISESISASSSGESTLESNDRNTEATEEKATKMPDEDYTETQRRTAAAVKVAASSVVDTVASGFRGRYSGTTAPPLEPAEEKRQAMRQSQTGLIMQSRAATHMQSILDSLEPQEYVMLLGNGMLGVNLKQAYLKNNGVYIDYLIEGGSAEMSGVVCVGDNLMKVGDVDVFRRGLILNVPQTIAAAKRPVVLVLSTGQKVPIERMNYIDVAVGMLHKIRVEKNGRRDIASMPIHSQEDEKSAEAKPSVEKEEHTPGNEVPTAPAPAENFVAEERTIDVNVPSPSFDGFNPMYITTPPLALRELVSPFVFKRYAPARSFSFCHKSRVPSCDTSHSGLC